MPTTTAPSETAEDTQSIARNASIIALGNIASRALGLVRDRVKSHYFGSTGPVSAYESAVIVPVTIYDLLIGGMVSSALVPVFSEYLAQGKKRELWELVAVLLAIITVVMAVFVILMQFAAPQVARFIAPSYNAELLALLTQLLRVLVFGLVFMSLAAVLSGLLYALKRFTLPTFTAALFNLGIIIGAFALHDQLGVVSLAAGLLLGALLQVLVQLPGLRPRPSASQSQRGFFGASVKTGLAQIARLYLPIILGLLVSNASVILSTRLINATGERSVAWNDYATSLMQFPLGLVVTAVSVAILPTLARTAVTSEAEFKATLARGLRLVLALIIPAVIGMMVLARPITTLLYQSGAFTPTDSAIVSLVLQVQMFGVFFAAIDQPLIFAFYARKDTLTPALVGIAGVGLYLSIAFLVAQLRPLTLLDLVAANDAQLAAHALVMLALFRRRMGGFVNRDVWGTFLRAGSAALAMGLLTYAALLAVRATTTGLALPDTLLMQALEVLLPGGLGALTYFFLAARLQLEEARLALDTVRQKAGL